MTARTASTLGIASETTIAEFTVREFRQPPHRRLPLHTHEAASISFVLAGSYVERLRGRDRHCSPSTIVLKPPHEPHADRFGPLGGHCLLVELSAERLAQVSPHAGIGSEPGIVRDPRLMDTGRRLHRELRGVDALSPLAIEGLVLEVLVDASRARARRSANDAPAWLGRVHELLADTFREPITLASIASAAGVHRTHLARVFRRHYGASIGEYVRRLRIEHAARVLATSDAAIADVGIEAGFYDQSHFTRAFARQVGETPARYRAAFGRR